MAKGIIAGCALGFLLSLTGLIAAPKGVVLGGLAGCLASITFKNRMDEKRDRDQ
ncbi:MAG: hypothetical protein V3571_07055 [Pseudodesulfovibrio sp.]